MKEQQKTDFKKIKTPELPPPPFFPLINPLKANIFMYNIYVYIFLTKYGLSFYKKPLTFFLY